MRTETNECGTVVLFADEGKTLTNGETQGAEIYLGANDRADNWREIEVTIQDDEAESEGGE